MAVTYTTAVKTASMTAKLNFFANGTLEILTATDDLLVTFGLNAAGGTVTGAVWTLVLDATPVAASGTGTAAKAQVKTAGAVVGITGLTVGTTNSNINLDNVTINTGQNVGLSSAVITHAP